MKKLIWIVLALLLIASAAFAEETTIVDIEAIEAAPVTTPEPAVKPESSPSAAPKEAGIDVVFQDGFSLTLPEGWLSYDVTADAAETGVLYCLSDGDAAHWLYIQRWKTDCADIAALSTLINETAKPKSSTIHTFNETDFVVYDLADSDVSCCATLTDGMVLNFVFTPQSDADYMATASKILGTFAFS